MLPSKTNLVANGRILAVHHGSNPVLKLNLCPFHRLNQLVDPGFIIGSWMSGHNNPKFTFWGVLHRHTTCNSRARSSMSSSRPSSPKHDKEDDRTPPSEPELKCSLTGEKNDADINGDPGDEGLVEALAGLAIQALAEDKEIQEATPAFPPLFPSFDIAGVAQLIKAGRVRRLVCMCGAGISVSAGIPDFRTPGTGLYSQLDAYNLPAPEAIFTLSYFRQRPEPFHRLARELFPGAYVPTPTHYFIKLLHDKGLLLRCFTQNIDSLEQLTGLPKDKVVAAHGNFDSAACIDCGKGHDTEWVRSQIFSGKICRCTRCKGLVKPAIVFFGEGLPDRFFDLAESDMPRCDLLLVMGTSLEVYPFAGLIGAVRPFCRRVLINLNRVGDDGREDEFDFFNHHRDLFLGGNCDDTVWALAEELGWKGELETLVQEGQKKFKKSGSVEGGEGEAGGDGAGQVHGGKL